MEPQRVPIIRPSSGVRPIVVSRHTPSSMAASEAPLPRWHESRRWQREGGYSYQEVDDMMNKQSGLLAISGISNDARDIRTRASEGDERCLLAFDMFAYKAMQQAGSMIASMAGVDTITFTAGIGENDWSIRKAFCDCFEWLGVRIDNNKNREAVGNGPQVISAAGSAVTVMVIPTDEEYMIAHDVERLTKNN